MGVGRAEETASFSGESVKSACLDLEVYKPTHSKNYHQGNSWRGASLLQEVGELAGNGVNAGQASRS